jgi:hypothetical protein
MASCGPGAETEAVYFQHWKRAFGRAKPVSPDLNWEKTGLAREWRNGHGSIFKEQLQDQSLAYFSAP